MWPKAVFSAPVLVALAYYAGAEAAFYVGTLSDRIFAPFWPPNVVLFCALLLSSERRWWVFIAAAFPAHVVAELGVGMPAAQLLVAFVTNCMVAVLNAFALRRLLNGPPWLADLRKASVFILITAGIGPAVSAFGGAFVQILGGGAFTRYWQFWIDWYFANVLTSLTLGALFLAWLDAHPKALAEVPRHRMIEAALIAVALVVVCAIALDLSASMVARGFLPALLYSPLPLVLWAALRFGTKGASSAILVVTVVVMWRTLKGQSPFLSDDPETNVLALQLFLVGLAIPLLLLGAAIEELRQAESTTRQLAGAVLRAQDEERRRIARELHDSTGQNLIAASMLVDRLRKAAPTSAPATVDQLEQTIHQMIDEVRTVSYVLHPPLLDEAGLEDALRVYLEGLCQRVALTIHFDVASDIGRLPADVELALFRVVQEAVTNVSRHSSGTTARIRLCRGTVRGKRGVILTVEDAGKARSAFDRVSTATADITPPNGVGLASMRERLSQIGGSLDVDFDIAKTTVTAFVPQVDDGAPDSAHNPERH
jgi:signal transduction histidine kinase